MQNIVYDLVRHRHRFAAWCASSAARTSPNCRFSVEVGVQLIEESELNALARGWSSLPETEAEFDAMHRSFRNRLVELAPNKVGAGMRFTHGVAAKLINCYLKPIFLCSAPTRESTEQDPFLIKQRFIHPPIDRLLLNELYARNFGGVGPFWRQYRDIGWSAFSAEQYEAVVAMARTHLGDRPLWHLEEHWGGYQ